MSFRDKRIETLQLITVAVCCGNVSNLIGRRTINIPEIIFGVHAFSVSTEINLDQGSKQEKLKVSKRETPPQNFHFCKLNAEAQ